MEEDIHHIQKQTFTDRRTQLLTSFLDTQLHNILLVTVHIMGILLK